MKINTAQVGAARAMHELGQPGSDVLVNIQIVLASVQCDSDYYPYLSKRSSAPSNNTTFFGWDE